MAIHKVHFQSRAMSVYGDWIANDGAHREMSDAIRAADALATDGDVVGVQVRVHDWNEFGYEKPAIVVYEARRSTQGC